MSDNLDELDLRARAQLTAQRVGHQLRLRARERGTPGADAQ
jgi:hypothetical protein